MSRDNLDWENFSCVNMMRSIRNRIDAKLANMTDDETSEYLKGINRKFSKKECRVLNPLG